GLFCRNLPLDIEWHMANLHADRTNPTLATKTLPAVLGETVANIVTLRERWDSLTLDDPNPGFAEIGGLLRGAIGKLIKSRRALDTETA
ncbi:MAG: hypothetical protein ACREEA_07475, partial [Stellaceae bacterium]